MTTDFSIEELRAKVDAARRSMLDDANTPPHPVGEMGVPLYQETAYEEGDSAFIAPALEIIVMDDIGFQEEEVPEILKEKDKGWRKIATAPKPKPRGRPSASQSKRSKK